MNWIDTWNSIQDFLKILAPAVITFAVFYVGVWLIKGYITVASMFKFIFEKPGRILFIIILFLVVMYLWNDFKVGLGW